MPDLARPRCSTIVALVSAVVVASLLGGCTTGPLLGGKEEVSYPSMAERLDDTSDPRASGATAQWAAAYAKKPTDPRMALGYARALKAIGSKEQALEVLKTSYQTAPTGEVAAELGRLALDMGRLDIAKATLQVAEAQGVRDWKTLSALGTLRAKQNQHAEAQQYFLAALQLEPNAVSVINNLALSYALDNKVDRAEDLLRNAVREGHEDKRVRQNLALVLGIEGKYDEARKVAQVDLPESDARANMAYLRNMLTQPTAVASLDKDRDEVDAVPNGEGGPEWQPYAGKPAAPKSVASASDARAKPKAKPVQVATATPRPVAQAPKQAAVPAAAPAKPASAQATASAAPIPAARVATLLPGESGSSTVPKSIQPAHPASSAKADKAPIAPSLLRANVD